MAHTSPHAAQLIRFFQAAAFAVLTLGAGVYPVSAGPDLGKVVSRMPMGVEFVAAVDNGASLRENLHGSPLMLAVAAMRKPAAVMNAWTDFATELNLTDAEAFDLLLGQRVIIVGSQLQADAQGDPRWAILSELDPETERRLRTLLHAVPRRIVAGQPILEFEHGSYLLATSSGRLECGPDGRFKNHKASSIMLLAPSSDRELFEQMLPLLRCDNPEFTLADLPAGRMVESWETKDAVVVWRIPDPLGSPHRFIGLTVGTKDAEWDIEAMAYPAAGWTTLNLDTISPWSPALLGTLPSDAAFAMIGNRETVREAQSWLEPFIGRDLPDPHGESFDRLLGHRSMLGVWLRDTPDAASEEPELLLAMDTPDLARLTPRAETYMHDLLLARSAEPNRNARISVVPSPLADVRLLSGTGIGQHPIEPAPTLSWAFVPEAAVSGEAGNTGWWLIHSFPNDHTQDDTPDTQDADAMAQLGRRPSQRYLHVGRIRPAAWSSHISRHAADIPSDHTGTALGMPALNAIVFSHIRSAEWAVWHEETGNLLRAQFRFQLNDTEPASE